MSKIKIRRNLKDIWNAFMVKGAIFSKNDIPICPTTSDTIPKKLISYKEAKTIFNRQKKRETDFHYDVFVHFYLDDQAFDGEMTSIWRHPKKAYEVLKHFEGIIIPDFSTYLDFPEPLKRWNYYRMYAFGYWYGILCQKKVIAQARWDYPESFSYCFDGIREGDMVAIGTIASGLKEKENRERFEQGLKELIRAKHPSALLIYGGINLPIFKELVIKGIQIVHFQSEIDVRLGGSKRYVKEK